MAPRKRKPITTALNDIDAQIARLQEEKKALQRKRSEQVVRLVQDSGLADVDIDDAALLEALKETAARFPGRKAS